MTRDAGHSCIAIVGLGYVGLPLAAAFGIGGFRVIGFDVDGERVADLRAGFDRTNQVGAAALHRSRVTFTNDPEHLSEASFIVISVPTPITAARQPDLSSVESASRTVGRYLRPGAIVVLESTVYPGVTEDVVGPIVAQESGLRAGTDFFLAYSPERANPGDLEHSVDRIVKVIAAQDGETLEAVASVYGVICKAGVYRAPDIRTAEAAKVIENVQRDLNIALVNELSLIFQRIGLDTTEVLNAAATKWNFHRYHPGLVGGHCIGVDPYYLTHLAERVGYHPQVILAGRRVNDAMAEVVAEMTIKGLIEAGKAVQQAVVLIMGLTFKENVNDTRNSKVRDVIRRLHEYGLQVLAHDPLLAEDEVRDGFSVRNIRRLADAPKVDAVILAVRHRAFLELTLDDLTARMNSRPVLVDVKCVFSRAEAEARQIIYKAL